MKTLFFFSRPVFRSYKPVNDEMQEGVLPEAQPGDVEARVQEELEREGEGVKIDKLVSYLTLIKL